VALAVDEPVEASSLNAVDEQFEVRAAKAESRRGLLLALPAWLYLMVLFVVPLLIVTVYSFATRTRSGTDLSGWNLESYRKLGEPIVRDILFRSLTLAVITTVVCLVIAYPFSYYLATRPERIRNVMLVFVMIPFWTNFLVRNFAWRVILGNDGPLTRITEAVGLGGAR